MTNSKETGLPRLKAIFASGLTAFALIASSQAISADAPPLAAETPPSIEGFSPELGSCTSKTKMSDHFLKQGFTAAAYGMASSGPRPPTTGFMLMLNEDQNDWAVFSVTKNRACLIYEGDHYINKFSEALTIEASFPHMPPAARGCATFSEMEDDLADNFGLTLVFEGTISDTEKVALYAPHILSESKAAARFTLTHTDLAKDNSCRALLGIDYQQAKGLENRLLKKNSLQRSAAPRL